MRTYIYIVLVFFAFLASSCSTTKSTEKEIAIKKNKLTLICSNSCRACPLTEEVFLEMKSKETSVDMDICKSDDVKTCMDLPIKNMDVSPTIVLSSPDGIIIDIQNGILGDLSKPKEAKPLVQKQLASISEQSKSSERRYKFPSHLPPFIKPYNNYIVEKINHGKLENMVLRNADIRNSDFDNIVFNNVILSKVIHDNNFSFNQDSKDIFFINTLCPSGKKPSNYRCDEVQYTQ